MRCETRAATGQNTKGTYFSFIILLVFSLPIYYLHFNLYRLTPQKIQEATSSQVIKINTMEVNKKYPIMGTERLTAKFGPTVLLYIKETPCRIVKVFVPKRYNSVTSDEDSESTKSQKVSLHLIFK